jgi:hypothetical protein
VIAHTFTRTGARCPFTGRIWPAGGAWLDDARAATLEHLALWIAPELWRVELAGRVSAPASQLLGERGRLVEHVAAWDVEAAKAFVAGCTARTLELASGRADDPALACLAEDAAACTPAAANLAGWLAARAAFAVSGPAGGREERARQALWLADRLGL